MWRITGIAPNTLAKLNCDVEVSLSDLGRICEVLDVDIGDIVEYTNSEMVNKNGKKI